MPKTAPPLANASGHADAGTAFAVLTQPLERENNRPLTAGHVVSGAPDAIAALIAAGGAFAATQEDVDISAPFHYPLPVPAGFDGPFPGDDEVAGA
jgi:hypothetical protein